MNSRAFRKFKNEIGQANHYLITIMIGLDAVDDGAKKRESFSTCWNPQNVHSSVERSKLYSKKSALAWAVDNLDMYLRLCNRKPKLYSDEEGQEISSTGHSVYKKFIKVVKNHPELSHDKIAYVDLLIAWRNNLVHFDAENKLLSASIDYFNNIPTDDIVVNKYNLDVDQMLERFKKRECPAFKEITTLISMTIHFVEELDNVLLENINQYEFLKNIMQEEIRLNNTSVLEFKNTTPEKRKKKYKNFFNTLGITPDFYNEDGERFLNDIIYWNKSDFFKDE